MKRTKKILVTLLCAVLLVTGTVAVTVAYLTDSASVQNTFTFGQVGISLDEAKVNTDGTVIEGEDAGRDVGNKYHLIPGHEYTKDPTIHVDDDSEDCWLFVKLNNGLKDIISGKTTYSEADAENSIYTIETQMSKNGWTCIDTINNVWAYKEIVSANEDVPVFGMFKLTDSADVAEYATAEDAEGNVTGGTTIDVTAYAVQADGFNVDEKSAVQNATAAWEAAFGATTSAE